MPDDIPAPSAAMEVIGTRVIEDGSCVLYATMDVSDVQNAAKAFDGGARADPELGLLDLRSPLKPMRRALPRYETKRPSRALGLQLPVCHFCSRPSAHRMYYLRWRWNARRSSTPRCRRRAPGDAPFSSKRTRPRSSGALSTRSPHPRRARPCRRRCARCGGHRPMRDARVSRSSGECATACSEATSSSASSTPPS